MWKTQIFFIFYFLFKKWDLGSACGDQKLALADRETFAYSYVGFSVKYGIRTH